MAARSAALFCAVLVLAGCATPRQLELSGDIRTHDPALVAGTHGDAWFVYSTGDPNVADGNIQIRRSENGTDWTYAGEVWEEKPSWLVEAVRGVGNLWAPELFEHDGTWYLYYSASTFGSNHSVIALATNRTLDPDDPQFEWIDRGPVVESVTTGDFNAIDPGIVEDADGTPWMSFGSFWSGIRMVQLEWPSGLRSDDEEPLRIADRGAPPNAIEAPYLVERDGWYYVFVSKDLCCRALDSTYLIEVGRSKEITGPFVDRDGVPLLEDGGTPVLSTEGSMIGPGGQSYSNGILAFHYYDGDNAGAFRLGLVELAWDTEGWPRAR